MAKYRVTVSADYRWPVARIAGREFAKDAPVTLGEHEMGNEIQRAASDEYGILTIEEIKPPKLKKAKKGKEEAEDDQE